MKTNNKISIKKIIEAIEKVTGKKVILENNKFKVGDTAYKKDSKYACKVLKLKGDKIQIKMKFNNEIKWVNIDDLQKDSFF